MLSAEVGLEVDRKWRLPVLQSELLGQVVKNVVSSPKCFVQSHLPPKERALTMKCMTLVRTFDSSAYSVTNQISLSLSYPVSHGISIVLISYTRAFLKPGMTFMYPYSSNLTLS